MYCDDCTAPVRMTLEEYVQRKEELGAVICTDCRNGWMREVEPVRPRA